MIEIRIHDDAFAGADEAEIERRKTAARAACEEILARRHQGMPPYMGC